MWGASRLSVGILQGHECPASFAQSGMAAAAALARCATLPATSGSCNIPTPISAARHPVAWLLMVQSMCSRSLPHGACHVEARGQGCHVMDPKSEVWCRYEQAAAPAELVMQGQEPARLLNALQALQQQLGSQVSLVGECSALSPLLQVRSRSCEGCMHALQLACWHAASKYWSCSTWTVWRYTGCLSRKRGGASLQLSCTPRRC